MANTHTQIYLHLVFSGLTNSAPTELNKPFIKHFYDDFAPTELIFDIEIDQLIYDLTEKEIKIVEAK